MRISPRPWLWLMALAVMSSGPAALAQDSKGEKATITTIDGVNLVGTFYAGRGSSAPAVLMLHALGESSKKEGWVHLAERLQSKGYAVLTFDFRGHGASKEVNSQEFWKQPFNRSNIKGAGKDTIEFREFSSAYQPALVNDIAAAKAYLDTKNDDKECNSSSLIVIGSETGATLGGLWMRSEWYRCRVKQDAFTGNPIPSNQPEGADTICGIWLTISPTLGSYRINLPNLLMKPGKEKAVPLLFLHGEEDKVAQKIAKNLERSLVTYKGKDADGNPKREEKFRYTAAVGLRSKLKGVALLQKSLATDTHIIDYLDQVVQVKGKGRTTQNFASTPYVWTYPRLMPAKLGGETLLTYNSYLQFLPQ